MFGYSAEAADKRAETTSKSPQTPKTQTPNPIASTILTPVLLRLFHYSSDPN